MTTHTATPIATSSTQTYPGPDGSVLRAELRITTRPVAGSQDADYAPAGATEFVRIEVWWSSDDVTIDREHTYSLSTGYDAKGIRLARRVLAAWDADALRHREATYRHDVNGSSYVQASWPIMGKYLNADLRRLGF